MSAQYYTSSLLTLSSALYQSFAHTLGSALCRSTSHTSDMLNHLALPHSSLCTLDHLSQYLHFANFLIKMFCMNSKHFILPLSSPSSVSIINAIIDLGRFQIQIFPLFLCAPCNNSTNYSSKSATASPKNSHFWVEFNLLNANQKIRKKSWLNCMMTKVDFTNL